IAPFVAMTVPTVAPLPKWQSGITATCLNTKPIEAVFSICFSAEASTVSGGRNNTALSLRRYIFEPQEQARGPALRSLDRIVVAGVRYDASLAEHPRNPDAQQVESHHGRGEDGLGDHIAG